MKKLKLLIPFLAFVVLVAFLVRGLQISGDKEKIPSPLIGKPAPTFSLPLLYAPDQTFSPEQMKGKVWLLNVWASWCTTCAAEHPMFMELSRKGTVPIVGMNYKEKDPEDGKQWLLRGGNPYQVVVSDRDGRIAIDYGLYGVPETYVIDKEGIIRFKQIGNLTREAYEQEILPLIAELQAK